MPAQFNDPAFKQQVRDELARIGGGGGINMGGPFTPEQLMEALRTTPDGGGAEVFFANLTEILRRSSGQ